MKRVCRWIFNAIAAMSLLLFLATSVLFVRSFWVGEIMDWTWSNEQVDVKPYYYQNREFDLARGGIMVKFIYYETASPMRGDFLLPERYFDWFHERNILNYPYSYLNLELVPKTRHIKGLGFELFFDYVAKEKEVVADRTTSITLPVLVLMLVFAIPPLIWLKNKYRNRFALDKTLCQTCGYDLRASKDRCPECGTAIPEKAQA